MNETEAVSQALTNKIIVTAASILSVLGSCIIILTFILFKDIRTPSRHIIVCIAISDLISSLSNCAGLFIKSNTACVIQSFVGSASILSSFLWTMFLAVFLFTTVVLENPYLGKRLIFPWFHLVSWFLPLAINITAAVLRELGNNQDLGTGGWCWIKLEDSKNFKKETIWMLIDGKGIELLTYVVILALYITIKIKLRSKIRSYSDNATQLIIKHTVKVAKMTDRKLVFIPICFILFRIWGTIRFFIYVYEDNEKIIQHHKLKTPQRVLLNIQSIGDNSLGAVNCILFCFLTPKVVHLLKQWFLGCFSICGCLPNAELFQSDEEDDVSSYSIN